MKILFIVIVYILSYSGYPEEIDIQKVIKKYKGLEKIPKELKGIWIIIDKINSCGPPHCYLKTILNLCKNPVMRKSIQIDSRTEKNNYEDSYKGFIAYPPVYISRMFAFAINEFDEFGKSYGGLFPLWYDPKRKIIFSAELIGLKNDEIINRIDATKENCPIEPVKK